VDIFTQAKRSEIMGRIRGKNTKPEMLVRKKLHAAGFRFRLHRKDLPGRPDITLPRHKTVIFVHGCFWHGHEGCKANRIPKTNEAFWREKIDRNRQRDARNKAELIALGWTVVEVWECEVRTMDFAVLFH
jgi:DNA mismatch endonuclease (patch repair protein)